uniref:Transthyretin-like family protein n=1 Tax=Steinernema glaseri TaxID=37863 RepID=A0A1I8AMT1_9BILA
MLLPAILLAFCGAVVSLGTVQSGAIRGTLYCYGKPAAGVKVRLFDDDGGKGNFLDDLMASGETDAEGHFSLQGHATEISTIDLLFRIDHTCNKIFLKSYRTFTVIIPDEYVTPGKEPKKFYEFGSMELSGRHYTTEGDTIY